MADSLPDVAQVIEMLADTTTRETALDHLHQHGESSVETLITALKNSDEQICLGVIWSLNRMNNSALGVLLAPVAADPLADLLQHDPSVRVRMQALQTLVMLTDMADRDGVIAPLMVALGDEQETIRAEAARWLAQMRDSQALKTLADLVANDPSDTVRGRAAYALAYIEPDLAALKKTGKAGTQALIMALADSELSVRLRAIWALGQIKHIDALNPLTAILEGDGMAQEKRQATAALGVLGNGNALEALIMALQFSDEEGVKRSAAEALGVLGDKRAAEALIQSLRHDALPAVRASAARALEELGGSGAVDDLIGALEDSSDMVRLRVVLALGAVGKKKAIKPLRALIEVEDSHQIRTAATQALDTLA